MSEVKPTLVFYDAIEETILLNSWLSNFPSGKWNDAQSRSWYWVIVSAVNLSSAYEYRVKFDVFVENTTLIFPFVVKTSDKGVKKVFINGVEYRVRSKENYGDRFVVSGQEFSFKVATQYKLAKQTVPILTLEYKQAVFRSTEFLTSDCIRLRFTSSEFNTVKAIETDYVATRNTQALYIISNTATCNCISTHTTQSTFNNVNSLSVPVITNCRDTSWVRFGGIWQSCETWIPLT
ncbi:hypothetical protein [uncultured virus]|uniref:Uncharacterized protein n=1 Tax=uncultured virus TaxID=340016 RepID=A0A5Q0TWI5_9VIRU|nr:hypothetical protein [uncultured virus]